MKTSNLILSLLTLALIAGCRGSESPPPEEASRDPLPSRPAHQAPPSPQTGQAPAFVLPTPDGDSLRLADFEGKTLLVNFWATWCGPCLVEIPDLVALQNELGDARFSVIGISMDFEDPEVIQSFVDRMGINYPIAIDQGDVAENFGGVYSLPTTFVVDSEGSITQRMIGLFPVDAFKPHLRSMIEAE